MSSSGLTIKPINSSFGRRRVIKRHCSFSFWPTGGLVRVDVDHWLASLLVYLKIQNESIKFNAKKYCATVFYEKYQSVIDLLKNQVTEYIAKKKKIQTIIQYLNDTNLLEVVANFLYCGIFSQSLDKNGVVVRVVLLTACEKDQWREDVSSDYTLLE